MDIAGISLTERVLPDEVGGDVEVCGNYVAPNVNRTMS